MWTFLAALILPAAGIDDATFLQKQLERVPEFSQRSSAARMRLWVAPNGRVEDCGVLAFMGDEEVAQRMCKLMLGRRMTSPVGPGGKPTYGYTELTSAFGANAAASSTMAQQLAAMRPGVDQELRIDSAKGHAVVGDVRLLLAISDEGKLVACEPLNARDKADVEYCGYLAGNQFERRQDKRGDGVSYLRAYTIRLTAG